ncbi:MAG: hypothetical protein EBR82_04020 [Caulobacteraceae bacterium]|nr:hypothetical protein [Caulobacteraceae bacterium]
MTAAPSTSGKTEAPRSDTPSPPDALGVQEEAREQARVGRAVRGGASPTPSEDADEAQES